MASGESLDVSMDITLARLDEANPEQQYALLLPLR
jgi:hypothetical protein